MPIVVNSNASATEASFNLSKANDALRKSLSRLSSGKKIVSPADDAGGLAVAYKLNSTINRNYAVIQNSQNALSYLQVQDAGLETVGKILDRMSELRVMAQDITKNEADIENYSKEFVELQSQLKQISKQAFNGISLFATETARVQTGEITGVSDTDLRVDGTFAYQNTDGTNVQYDKFGRTLTTHASGINDNGSISLNVVNLQFVLSIGTTAQNSVQNVDLGGLNNEFEAPTLTAANNASNLTFTGKTPAVRVEIQDVSGGANDPGAGNVSASVSSSGGVDTVSIYFNDDSGAPDHDDLIAAVNASASDYLSVTAADGTTALAAAAAADLATSTTGRDVHVNGAYTSITSTTTGIGADNFIDSILDVDVSQFTEAIERLADMRAENGAEQNRVLNSIEMLQTTVTNLEAAHGRIMDADIALESTRFARQNVLVQASASMAAQANQLTNVALSLLG